MTAAERAADVSMSGHVAGAGCSCETCLRAYPSVTRLRSLVWIIYDGRAEFDEHAAAVYQTCSTRRDLKRALWYWRGCDGVVFEYEANGRSELVNGRRLGSVSVGPTEMLRRASRRGVRVDSAESKTP